MPVVAAMVKPSSTNAPAASRPDRLVAVGQRQEHRARPRQRSPAAIWLLANARPKVRSMPMTSPVERISGPEHRVGVGEPVERQHRLLHRHVAAGRRRAQQAPRPQLGERGADHHAGRDLHERHAGGLGHERHGAAGPRVGLDHEHLVGLHRVLHVDEADDLERLGDGRVCSSITAIVSADSEYGGIAHAESPECTPASSTCSITAPMNTSPVWSRMASTSTSVASSEEPVDEHGPLGGQAALAAERAEAGELGHRPRQGDSSS